MSTEMVPSPSPAAPLAPTQEQEGDLLMVWQKQAVNVACSFNPETNEGKNTVLRCLARGDKQLQNCVNAPMPVVDWFAHVVELPDLNTGEIKTLIRLVLILEDRSTVSTGSNPFTKGWAHVMHMHGRGPYNPPLLVTAESVPMEGGKKYLQLKAAWPRGTEPGNNGKPPRK